jgi:DNA-binding NtrC family response regulator
MRTSSRTATGGHTGVLRTDAGGRLVVRRVRIRVVKGPDRGEERLLEGGSLFVGKHGASDLVLTDDTVSRQHAELTLLDRGVRVRDLDSKNGTFFGGSRVESVVVPVPCEVRVGDTRLELYADDESLPEAPPERTELAGLVGESAAMRRVLGLAERVAATSVPVLIEGEEGVGKSALAAAIHRSSSRRNQPLVALDAGEAGAVHRVPEAFASASLGTLVIERVDHAARPTAEAIVRELASVPGAGEAASDLAPRVIATSRADLRERVVEGAFPRDLYFLVAAVRIVIPPLRERIEDVPRLVSRIVQSLGRSGVTLTEKDLGVALRSDYRGNVRELEMLGEGALSRRGPPAGATSTEPPLAVDDEALADLPYKDAKEQVVDAFTRRYLEQLLDRHDGNVSRAAEEAGLGRNHLTRLLQKHGLK